MKKKPTSPAMAQIPSGPFGMGDYQDGNRNGDSPKHTVTLDSFLIDTDLVSFQLWGTVQFWALKNGYQFDHPGASFGAQNNQPVQSINWWDCAKWCNARSEQEGLAPVYLAFDVSVYRKGQLNPTMTPGANGYRLPTEAEWEKAARGGLAGLRFPLDNFITHAAATYQSPLLPVFYDHGPFSVFPTQTTPVGSPHAPNGYGLRDMAGNLNQWCWDWYGKSFYANGTTNPTGPFKGNFRVNRGGSWKSLANGCRTGIRSFAGPTAYGDQTGFRTVRSGQ